MKIDRVSYQKIFPTGMAYLNHRIGVEVQITEGDNLDEAFKLAKETVERWNLESNPGMAATLAYNGYSNFPDMFEGQQTEEQQKETMNNRVGLIAGDINSCEELKVLESYRLIVKQVPELQSVYEKKFNQLSKK